MDRFRRKDDSHGTFYHAHNLWLHLLFEGGIVAALLATCALGLGVVRNRGSPMLAIQIALLWSALLDVFFFFDYSASIILWVMCMIPEEL